MLTGFSWQNIDHFKNLGCIQRMIVKWVLTKQEEQYAVD
jgi:hypothetical protein